ncbi:MAG: hypothetical protein Q8Q17_00760 [bacterium]|nr:hypothetical protein [bacterium]
MPALQKPTLEKLQAKFAWIYSVEHDKSPIEKSFLGLGTVLREDEQYPIKGDEYRRRITSTSEAFFGYQHALWLVERQDELPEYVKIFKKVYEDEPVVYSRPYVDFLGFVVRDENDNRAVPHIGVAYSERLFLGWTWLDRGFRISGRIAVVGPSIPIAAG